MKKGILPLTAKHRYKIGELTKAHLKYAITFYLSETLPTSVVYINEEGVQVKAPWLEFVLCELGKGVLGEFDPKSKSKVRKKGRRPYYTQVLAGQFGKEHPVDFLYEHMLKNNRKEEKIKSCKQKSK